MHSKRSNVRRSDEVPLLTRREAFQTSALLLGAACLCHQVSAASIPQASCCSTPDVEPESIWIGDEVISIDLTKAPSLAAVPSAAYIVAPEKAIQLMVLRRAMRDYAVLSRLCTHGSQVISYVPKRKLLQCNGFNHSLFRPDGTVFKGPAEAPLKSFPAQLCGSVLRIAYKEARP